MCVRVPEGKHLGVCCPYQVFQTKDYTTSVRKCLSALAEQGYKELRVKNFWSVSQGVLILGSNVWDDRLTKCLSCSPGVPATATRGLTQSLSHQMDTHLSCSSIPRRVFR